MEKATLGFHMYGKLWQMAYGKFWSISLGHFIKHKPLISDKWGHSWLLNYCKTLTCSLETGEGGIITSLGFDEVDSRLSLSLLFRTLMPILDEDPENSVVPASDPLKNKIIIFLVKHIVKSIFQPTKCNQNINFFHFHK